MAKDNKTEGKICALAFKQHQQRGHLFAQFPAVYDKIEEPMLEQKFAALKSWWQVFLDSFLDHAWTGKSDQGARFCNIQVSKHSKRCGNPTERRISEQ